MLESCQYLSTFSQLANCTLCRPAKNLILLAQVSQVRHADAATYLPYNSAKTRMQALSIFASSPLSSTRRRIQGDLPIVPGASQLRTTDRQVRETSRCVTSDSQISDAVVHPQARIRGTTTAVGHTDTLTRTMAKREGANDPPFGRGTHIGMIMSGQLLDHW